LNAQEMMPRETDRSDIAVIGAGPCGIGVGIAAMRGGRSCTLFDKGSVASSIGHYPVYMTFFSTAERLEIGDVPFTVAGEKPTRREAIRYYQRLVRHFDLDVRQFHAVERVSGAKGRIIIDTRTLSGVDATHEAANVVIATGYFDHPNLLGVTGEELPHVRHGYSEGHRYFRQRVVIVGGGNSAVDAALELHRWDARVTIVHFEEGLDKGVKPWVLPDITARIRDGAVDAVFRSRVIRVSPSAVTLRDEDTGVVRELETEHVLLMTGYTPDPALLRSLGVTFDDQTGKPHHDPATMQTNVPGVFIAGVVAAGNNANKVFIENGRHHGRLIVESLHPPMP
jgi:bacillithiol disulfide reductase